MGHLINPIGYRVGQTTGWVDTWFAYSDFYPEFLHFVLKIRLYLNYRFSSISAVAESYEKNDKKSLYKTGILYSHYRIIFDLSSVFIALYVYPGYYWDTAFEKKSLRFSFAGVFSKRYYLSDKHISKDIPRKQKTLALRIRNAGETFTSVFDKGVHVNNRKNSLKKKPYYLNHDVSVYEKRSKLTAKSWRKLFIIRDTRMEWRRDVRYYRKYKNWKFYTYIRNLVSLCGIIEVAYIFYCYFFFFLTFFYYKEFSKYIFEILL